MAQQKETEEAKGETEGMSSSGVSCPVCGLPREEWKENGWKGIKHDKLIYCSQACARQK